jgi:hypothetical protein
VTWNLEQYEGETVLPERLDIKSPPCEHCEYWKPYKRYAPQDKNNGVMTCTGIRCCTANVMEPDFSCFESK